VKHKNQCSAMQTGIEDMSTIMDVDEIHMPNYEPTTTWVEEEQNPTQRSGSQEEEHKE
jgi:hypothetical protein